MGNAEAVMNPESSLARNATVPGEFLKRTEATEGHMCESATAFRFSDAREHKWCSARARSDSR